MIYKQEWWAEQIYFKELKIDLLSLEEKCKELSKTDKGRKESNVGGWQSNEIINPTNDIIEPILKQCKDVLEAITLDFNIKKEYTLKHGNSWININQPNDYNLDHCHRGSFFSSVFYVKSKDKKAKLVLSMPSGHEKECYFQDFLEEGSRYTSPRLGYTPQEGQIIFFPSYLLHHVLPSTEERISIATNFIIT